MRITLSSLKMCQHAFENHSLPLPRDFPEKLNG